MKLLMLIATSSLLLAHSALAAPVVPFDFDTSAPAVVPGQGLPLIQTSGGVTAQFSSQIGLNGFSIQSDASTGFTLSQFSGNYLNPNGINPGPLDILFSQMLSSITLTFATTDIHQVEATTTVLLTAYVDSTAAPAVGSATANAVYGGRYVSDGHPDFHFGRVLQSCGDEDPTGSAPRRRSLPSRQHSGDSGRGHGTGPGAIYLYDYECWSVVDGPVSHGPCL